MNTLVPTEARLSARARRARRPCRARAMPRQAKTRAAASGMAASRAAMAGRWRVASTMRYWAVKLTAAAAAARTHRPAAALRSHRPDRSGAGRELGRGAGAASERGQREGDDGCQGGGAAGGAGAGHSCRMTRCARMSGFRCHAARMRRRVRTRLLRARTAGGRAGTSPLGCSRPVTSCGPGEMRNERLRALLLERGKSPDQLAEHVRVDPKTVERWITRGRLPTVGTGSRWPRSSAWMRPTSGRTRWARTRSRRSRRARSWRCTRTARRFPGTRGDTCSPQAEREIGVLVYSGLFLSEDAGIQKILTDKAARGRAGADPAR